MATPRDKIQDMLCEKIDALEATMAASAKRVRNMHTTINIMENNRRNDAACAEAATFARETIDAIADALEAKP